MYIASGAERALTTVVYAQAVTVSKRMSMSRILLCRVYDPLPDKGRRYLVDRLWPRGIRKEQLKLDGWLRELAPSTQLRRWFGHDPARWEGFKQRYFSELEQRPEHWRPLLAALEEGPVVLLYAARDRAHNNAAALKEFLEQKLSGRIPPGSAPDP